MRKLHRWQLFLSQFNAVYEHVVGKNNFIVDYLTREHEFNEQRQAPMEQLDNTQLIQNFEDILINVNEYCEAVNEKIEAIEEIVVDLRADLGKARELTNIFPPNY